MLFITLYQGPNARPRPSTACQHHDKGAAVIFSILPVCQADTPCCQAQESLYECHCANFQHSEWRWAKRFIISVADAYIIPSMMEAPVCNSWDFWANEGYIFRTAYLDLDRHLWNLYTV